MKLFCNHVYSEVLTTTPINILNSLIEYEFCYDMALDSGLTKRINWMADYYRREYGEAKISNLICIKCGKKEDCIKTMEDKMRKELTSFLFRADKNLTDIVV